MRPPVCKLGLVLPPELHRRMLADAGPEGVSAAYGRAFAHLLAAVENGELVTFAAVRGRKTRVTVRLPRVFCDRLRLRLTDLNLKITDFACAAVERRLNSSPGD